MSSLVAIRIFLSLLGGRSSNPGQLIQATIRTGVVINLARAQKENGKTSCSLARALGKWIYCTSRRPESGNLIWNSYSGLNWGSGLWEEMCNLLNVNFTLYMKQALCLRKHKYFIYIQTSQREVPGNVSVRLSHASIHGDMHKKVNFIFHRKMWEQLFFFAFWPWIFWAF